MGYLAMDRGLINLHCSVCRDKGKGTINSHSKHFTRTLGCGPHLEGCSIANARGGGTRCHRKIVSTNLVLTGHARHCGLKRAASGVADKQKTRRPERRGITRAVSAKKKGQGYVEAQERRREGDPDSGSKVVRRVFHEPASFLEGRVEEPSNHS